MRGPAVLLSVLTISSTFLFACERAPNDVMTAHRDGKGTVREYDASLEDSWKAAHAVLSWDGAGTPEDHPDQRYVVTNNPSSSGASYGDQVGVWFEPIGPKKTRVNVIVIQRETAGPSVAGPSAPGGPDEQTVQKDLGKALGLLQSGQPLPDKHP